MKLKTDYYLCEFTSESEEDRDILRKLEVSISENLSEGMELSHKEDSDELILSIITYV